MITAKQAFDITNRSGNFNNTQMAEIITAILEDAIEGQNCCAIKPTSYTNFWEIHKYFTERGFDVSLVTVHTKCTGMEDYGVALISWKNPNEKPANDSEEEVKEE